MSAIMKNDFEMLSYNFCNEIIIVPVADLHYGSPNFNLDKWKLIKNKIISTDNMYMFIIGDMIDNQTKNSHDPFGNTIRPHEQKIWLTEELKPLADKGKVLVVVKGNHENKKDNVASDDEILYDVCYKLGIEDRYRPNMAFIKIQIGERNGTRQTYTFGITHGTGGGTLTGTSVNKNEKFGMVIDGLDCLITAHTHKPVLTKPCKLFIDTKNNKITFKSFWQIIATSFLDYGNYALKGQMNPSSFMEQEITLKKTTNKQLEIKVK